MQHVDIVFTMKHASIQMGHVPRAVIQGIKGNYAMHVS